MTDRTTSGIWNDDDGEKKEKRVLKKPHTVRNFLLLTLILIVVLGVVLMAAYRDGTGFDVLRRYLNYGRVEAASGETVYDYDASSRNHFAVLGDCLAVLSDNSLEVLSPSGDAMWSGNVKMENPVLVQSGDRAAAYDVGGTKLFVLDQRGLISTLETGEEEPFIAVTMNKAGWLAVTTEDHNYKGCVTVYDEKMEKVFKFQSSQRFVLDAYVTDDCKTLAAVTLGQENSVFVSNIVLYDLSKQDPVADYDIR